MSVALRASAAGAEQEAAPAASAGVPEGARRPENVAFATPEDEKALRAAAESVELPEVPPESDLAKFLADDTPSAASSPRAHGN